jgi:hypothetical protein
MAKRKKRRYLASSSETRPPYFLKNLGVRNSKTTKTMTENHNKDQCAFQQQLRRSFHAAALHKCIDRFAGNRFEVRFQFGLAHADPTRQCTDLRRRNKFLQQNPLRFTNSAHIRRPRTSLHPWPCVLIHRILQRITEDLLDLCFQIQRLDRRRITKPAL